MRPPVALAVFAAVLVTCFGVGLLLGTAVGGL
jgi:hypothetical protein